MAEADNPFGKVENSTIAVEVSTVVRASPDSFQLRWREITYTNGTLIDSRLLAPRLGSQSFDYFRRGEVEPRNAIGDLINRGKFQRGAEGSWQEASIRPTHRECLHLPSCQSSQHFNTRNRAGRMCQSYCAAMDYFRSRTPTPPSVFSLGFRKTIPASSSTRRTASTLAGVLPSGPLTPSIRFIV